MTPGLSSEEVSLVEKSNLDEGSGNSQGWNGNEGVCTQHSPAARRPWGLGKAVPAILSRAGKAKAWAREKWAVYLPLLDRLLQTFLPTPPASADFPSSLLASKLFLASDEGFRFFN